MGEGIVHVVKIQLCLEIFVARSGEEVQASVFSQQIIAQLHHGSHRREHQHIVVSLPAGESQQLCLCIFTSRRVEVVKRHTVCRRILCCQQLGKPVKLLLPASCHNQQSWPAVTVQNIVDCRLSHGAIAGEHQHISSLTDAHLMHIAAVLCVIHGVECPDHTAVRLRH